LQPAVKTNDSAWAIRLELRCAPDVGFQALKLDKLRFYLDGESGLVNILYELLFSRLNRIMVRDLSPGSRLAPVTLPASALSAAGFAPDQGMVPYASSSFAGHRLLMEYFAFPEKFFFVDLSGLECLAPPVSRMRRSHLPHLPGGRRWPRPAARARALEKDVPPGMLACGESLPPGRRAHPAGSAQV
jgi:type VI protein secretion system component VasA